MKKKIYSFCIVAFIAAAGSINSNAAIVNVNVRNFEFIPSDFTIAANDTIIWIWENNGGNHNTTSGTIPVGATPWGAPINSNSTVFLYVPVIAGSYNYSCTFHASMGMTGHFTVAGSSGIADVSKSGSLHLTAVSPATSVLKFQYGILNNTKVNIHLFDIIGNKVQTLFSASQNTGTYDGVFDVQMLHSGIYMLVLETETAVVSQRVVLQ
ncbi:MAG: T9SS type A sorting domain-containing protein [Bacteroidetes bacterium]|nr:T9SS type A sorting domain-containing protein [Bacteroidota bacterium]